MFKAILRMGWKLPPTPPHPGGECRFYSPPLRGGVVGGKTPPHPLSEWGGFPPHSGNSPPLRGGLNTPILRGETHDSGTVRRVTKLEIILERQIQTFPNLVFVFSILKNHTLKTYPRMDAAWKKGAYPGKGCIPCMVCRKRRFATLRFTV